MKGGRARHNVEFLDNETIIKEEVKVQLWPQTLIGNGSGVRILIR